MQDLSIPILPETAKIDKPGSSPVSAKLILRISSGNKAMEKPKTEEVVWLVSDTGCCRQGRDRWLCFVLLVLNRVLTFQPITKPDTLGKFHYISWSYILLKFVVLKLCEAPL